MARSPVFVGDVRAFTSIRGLEQLQKKIAKIPIEVIKELQPAIRQGAEEMAARVKAIAPVSAPGELTPGALRDSVHAEPGRHELSYAVTVDARDQDGKYFAKHVEHGHKAGDGAHVPPVPFFWPAYRVTRKRIRARISRAIAKAVKRARGI